MLESATLSPLLKRLEILGYLTRTIEPGIAAPVRVAVGNDVVTGRDRFFVLLGVGVTFGGPVD